MVVAATPSGVIGCDGRMPWHLGSDLVRFKSITMSGTLVMGRKTFDSIGRPLPGRQTIVLSRDAAWHHPGVVVVNSSETAIEAAERLGKPAFVVGGAEIYQLMLPYVSEIWSTLVWSAAVGDTQVPTMTADFHLIQACRLPQTDRDSVPTELQRWVRKNSVPKAGVPIEL